ncbi:ABC transporter substrate-binding protein [Marinobacterium sp. D7]|uniref:ABC transporter substrate-binding protein n=1 Tax=Marinobacterium ramblicola TaxID=2849041 RepID=UPI001C2DA317|nr:ABC transporter substrate-binding protein [Marinobacterium ramblicola]MBV1788677.1 ABC transporter substrate-binding protein [Marinobacterium ramblicola]
MNITIRAAIVCLLSISSLQAAERRIDSDQGFEQFTTSKSVKRLDIYSATDTRAIKPIIEAFARRHPYIDVRYNEYESTTLYNGLTSGKITGADVVLSSAMDLQVKLVNDGHARTLNIPESIDLPEWSHWRNEAFGFTFEPVVIAYNKASFKDTPVPSSHESLVDALRNDPERYYEKVGSYDIRLSGAGYFFATHDTVVSSISGRILESLARASSHTYCCTSDMLDDLVEGKLALAYNVLGSYALARARKDDRIGVIMPEDYTLVMSRIALVPKQTDNFAAAQAFIRFLLSKEGQQIIASKSNLIALRPEVTGPSSIAAISEKRQLRFHPIKIGLPVMTFQDEMKRERFIREWSQLFDARAP